ncbi:MAG: hypothetical protein PNH44_00640 [Candidatus Carsonella ruddii]|nr:MAG: hypothetical protein PNH44_00640 [Candidatus Carsonella ruddii]
MNFQIFKKLSILGYIIFNVNFLFLTKKLKNNNNYFYYLNKYLFSKSFKFKKKIFFFFLSIKYIKYGNNFVCYYLLWYFNIYLKFNFKKYNKKFLKKKNKLINIININNLKIFKIYCKIRRNLIRKYSLNLTRKIVEKHSFKKLLKSILL